MFEFLFSARWQPGKIFHICAGQQNSLTVGELFELSFDLLGLAERKPKILTENAPPVMSTVSTSGASCSSSILDARFRATYARPVSVRIHVAMLTGLATKFPNIDLQDLKAHATQRSDIA